MLHRDSKELLVGSFAFLIFCLLLTFVLPVWYRSWRRCWCRLHDLLSLAESIDGRMIWLFLALAIGSGIVIAGRAHSKRLDELDDLHSQGFFNDPY